MSAFLYGVFVFIVAFFTDVVWAFYTMSTADRRPVRAALFAVLIVLCGLVGWDAYHRSYWNVMPFAAGCGLGTYLTVKKNPRV